MNLVLDAHVRLPRLRVIADREELMQWMSAWRRSFVAPC